MQGRFQTKYPFLDLRNVLGSPHNSGIVPGTALHAARQAAANIRRYLRGEDIAGIVRREGYR